MSFAIIWFRRDLRLADHSALHAALTAGLNPIPVYLHCPEEEQEWAPGSASRTWLRRSIIALEQQLQAKRSRLIIRHGKSLQLLRQLIFETGATAVYWHRQYEPHVIARDAVIKQALRTDGIEVKSFNDRLLVEPWHRLTRQQAPYRVFTPFWRATAEHVTIRKTIPSPKHLPAVAPSISSEGIACLGPSPQPPWDQSFWQHWQPGEIGAHRALDLFIDGALNEYPKSRDFPGFVSTSRLSPHLCFGEIIPSRIIAELEKVRCPANSTMIDSFQRQLGWREFGYYLLYHFPKTPTENLNRQFDALPWVEPTQSVLKAWQQGRTGVPLVDAGMRELWHTGWMHNRVRMIAASYFCKHLRLDWRLGARWFWETLLDADLANNTLGWQWVAGTGADAAPYYRIFNPVIQAERFDPQAKYITHWLPELESLPMNERFAPWQNVQVQAGKFFDYPHRPIVDLHQGRQAALDAYAKIRGKSSEC